MPGPDTTLRENLAIRRLERGDIDAVLAIERRSFAAPWPRNAFETEVDNPAACYLVAHLDGGIVGYAGMWFIMDEVHVTTVAVDSTARSRGLGATLVLALMDEAVNVGAERATLEVRESNDVAHRLYLRFGFRDAAIRRRYYTDNNENAIVMWADDLQSAPFRERLDLIRQALAAGERLPEPEGGPQ